MGLCIIFMLYQAVHILMLPVFGMYLFVRKIKKKSIFGNFKERMGFVPKVSREKKSIWIHAVSVGEVLSVQRLVEQIKKRFPDYACYLTVGTVAGKSVAQKNIKADYISFLPYDFFLCMWFVYRRIRPQNIIVVEAEIWPNFLMIGKFKKIPMYLLNARVSTRSEKRLYYLKWFFRPLFNVFTHIYAQSSFDTIQFKRFLKIPEHKLTLLGNIKAFNVEPKKELAEEILGVTKTDFNTHKKYKILLVGSVHPGELDVHLKLFKTLKSEHKNLKMILVPRHFHWKDRLVDRVDAMQVPYFLWDQNTPELQDDRFVLQYISETVLPNYDIMLVCTMGKLFYLYALADIFFLGGTFVPVGGHNLLEPAVWAKPVFVGPYYHNCQDIADQLHDRGALEKVRTSAELQKRVAWILEHEPARKAMGENASGWLSEQARSVGAHLDDLFSKIQ
ncbi:MAG: glycosyltransferase N-terminal domain-containing protein [bacterium]